MTDPVVPKAESCPEDDIDGGMWSAAETLCKLLADNEKKIGQPHQAGLVTGKAGLWRGNAAMNHVDLIRVPIHGFTAMVNTHENDCYMDSGIGFHGAKALESVYGILNDGQIRPVSTTEGGIQYAASKGFYAQSFAPGHYNEETNLRHWKALNDAIGHRSDTGLIFEIHWRADKKVISRSCDEEKHCRDGVCTRLKSSEDRYMFHPNNAELAALWITTHWMNYADVTMCHLNKTHTNRCLGANVTSVCLHAAKARSVGGGASCGNSDYSGASGGWGDGAWSNYRHQTPQGGRQKRKSPGNQQQWKGTPGRSWDAQSTQWSATAGAAWDGSSDGGWPAGGGSKEGNEDPDAIGGYSKRRQPHMPQVGDWTCGHCGGHNFGRRSRDTCFNPKCRMPKWEKAADQEAEQSKDATDAGGSSHGKWHGKHHDADASGGGGDSLGGWPGHNSDQHAAPQPDPVEVFRAFAQAIFSLANP